MNWYKKSRLIDRRLGDPNIPDEWEYEFLTGKDPNEVDKTPGSTYQPGKTYFSQDNKDLYNITDKLKHYDAPTMDLDSDIAAIEETIESYQKELKNPSLSIRRTKGVPIRELNERRNIKLRLRKEIKRADPVSS